MIGIILSGHNRFAEGMASAIELIAGKQEAFVCVNFEQETEQLEKDMQEAAEKLSDCEHIIVFTDLAGGSPFKTAGMLGYKNPAIDVFAGVNLPMLCEAVLSRAYCEDYDMFIKNLLHTGKEQVVFLDKTISSDDTDEEL